VVEKKFLPTGSLKVNLAMAPAHISIFSKFSGFNRLEAVSWLIEISPCNLPFFLFGEWVRVGLVY
jgi:hypothetical protein